MESSNRSRAKAILETTATLCMIASSIAIVVVAVILVRTTMVASRPSAPPQPTGAQVSQVTRMDGEATIDGNLRHHDGAQIVMIEFTDYQCPFCGKYARETHAELQRALVDSGLTDYVLKNYPLPIHPLALKAAAAAECAGQQGKYWQMHDILFSDQKRLAEPELHRDAHTLNLDENRFDACLTGAVEAKIQADIAEGQRLGIKGTPTFMFGVPLGNGKVKLLRKITGAQPLEAFKQAVQSIRDQQQVAKRGN